MTKTSRKTSAPAAPKSPAPAEAGKLGKTGLVEQMSQQGGLGKAEAAAVVDTVLETMIEALRSGKTVGLPGLGTFSVRSTAARQGVRPGTAEKIQIPAGKKISFKIALDLKKSL